MSWVEYTANLIFFFSICVDLFYGDISPEFKIFLILSVCLKVVNKSEFEKWLPHNDFSFCTYLNLFTGFEWKMIMMMMQWSWFFNDVMMMKIIFRIKLIANIHFYLLYYSGCFCCRRNTQKKINFVFYYRHEIIDIFLPIVWYGMKVILVHDHMAYGIKRKVFGCINCLNFLLWSSLTFWASLLFFLM